MLLVLQDNRISECVQKIGHLQTTNNISIDVYNLKPIVKQAIYLILMAYNLSKYTYMLKLCRTADREESGGTEHTMYIYMCK